MFRTIRKATRTELNDDRHRRHPYATLYPYLTTAASGGRDVVNAAPSDPDGR